MSKLPCAGLIAVVLSTSTTLAAEKTPDPRLFELRTYPAEPGEIVDLLARFRNHTCKLFEQHGMTNPGYFQPFAGQPPAAETLLYFLAHKDAATAAKSWADFRSDPVWVAVKKTSRAIS